MLALNDLGYANGMKCKAFQVVNEQRWMFSFTHIDDNNDSVYLLFEVLERDGGLVGSVLHHHGIIPARYEKIVNKVMEYCALPAQ